MGGGGRSSREEGYIIYGWRGGGVLEGCYDEISWR